MMIKHILAATLLAGVSTPIASAGEAYYEWETSCMIRKDKFDFVLPKAMKQNNVDMWIVIDKGRGTEPLARDFGANTSNGSGVFIFTRRDDGSVERAMFRVHSGLPVKCGAYDVIGYEGPLKDFVASRNPSNIAVNYTTATDLIPMEGRHLADGLSHTDYLNLKKELGKKYAERLVSAEKLIADFRGERVAGEIIEFSKIADLTRKLEERALSNEVITPGKTTLNDVGWWLMEKRKEHGAERGWSPTVFLSPPDGNEIANNDYVIQPGDVLQIDWGIGKNNFFTDIKRFSYVMKKGQTTIAPDMKEAFNHALKVRKIIRNHVKPGKPGRVILDSLKEKLREAGYVYTEDEQASDVEGIEVNVGMHATGNLGHEVTAAMFEIYPERTKYTVRENSIIAFEYIVFVPLESWGGRKMPVNIEENALITRNGIEWLHPPQNEILVIR